MPARAFAIIPAAGHSLRMGQPKLLMPLAGKPLLIHTIAAWQHSNVDRILVVVRPGDEPVADVVRQVGVELVIPSAPPPDMKVSLQAALRHIEGNYSPTDADAFLVAPADMPRLSPAIINLLINRHAESTTQIFVPTLAGRHGHPVLFPWTLVPAVHALAPGEGLNALVHRHQPWLVPCDDLASIPKNSFTDIDTPDEYRQTASEYQSDEQRD